LRKSCSICGAAVAARAENPAFPFCGERCRLIDLGRWLGEEYRVPDEKLPANPDSSSETH
jgi:endogenous inhibitor of DNA gyrase (YacG/DUF329 family)